ncbi:MAG: ribosome recycling factor [bacterium]|nr:ribosome recycling factor [bacterium]
MQSFLQDCKKSFDHVLDVFIKDIASLRTGRATPALVEDIEAEYYGNRTPIKHMAAIHVTGPTSLVIQPWDKGAVKPIEDALLKSQLGINPVVDNEGIRLNLPQLTKERREQLVKLLHQKAEEARIEIRKSREDALRAVQRLFDEKELREDERFKAKDDVQKLVDEYNKKIEEAVERKDQEIMTL